MRYKVCVVYMNSIRLFLSNLFVAAFGTRCIAVPALSDNKAHVFIFCYIPFCAIVI